MTSRAMVDPWQPIEAAPRDGRKLLVYGVEHHRRVWGIGYYFRGVPGDGEGWIAHNFYSEPQDDLRCSFTPTHYQEIRVPLAEEPTA